MKRWQKFKRIKRSYYAFWIVAGAFGVSFLLPLLVNDQALMVSYRGSLYFPLARYHAASEFGGKEFGPPDYRELKARLAMERSGFVLMPPYPYGPAGALASKPWSPPSREHIFGTDDRGRDVFAVLAYGFKVSMLFALIVLAISYSAGISIGAVLGYFGGKLDMLGQRGIEIWTALPILYVVVFLAAMLPSSFWLLVAIVSIFSWMSIAHYVRGEFFREKSKDYVAAAVALGASSPSIVFRHILPNALTPVLSFAPFAVVTNITALVALDFLGFGLRPPTPSWGELINLGVMNFREWWLVLFPLGALFVTLMLIVLVGEGLRSAFDPRTDPGYRISPF